MVLVLHRVLKKSNACIIIHAFGWNRHVITWRFQLDSAVRAGSHSENKGGGGGGTRIIFDANFLCAPRIRVKRALWVSRDDYKPGGAAGRSRNWAASRRSGWRPPPSSSHSQPAPSRTLRRPQGSHPCTCHIHARTRSCAGRWAAFLRLDRGNPGRCPPAGPGTGPGIRCWSRSTLSPRTGSNPCLIGAHTDP